MNTTLVEFEATVALGPTYAARLLGVSYSIYAQYRSEHRALPRYHRNHIQALLRVPRRELTKLIKEHAHGQNRNR